MTTRALRGLPALVLLVSWLTTAAPALAAPPVAVPNEMPLAGPPPEGDLLPPLPDQVRARAAVEMLLVVLAGLALIAVLLRWVGRRQAAPAAPAPDTPFDRARKALEEQDRDGKLR